jgi:hypothetical protein
MLEKVNKIISESVLDLSIKLVESKMKDIKKLFIACRKHIAKKPEMESSARVALADAIKLYDEGEYDKAYRRALKSLQYSVGVFHREYKRFSI